MVRGRLSFRRDNRYPVLWEPEAEGQATEGEESYEWCAQGNTG